MSVSTRSVAARRMAGIVFAVALTLEVGCEDGEPPGGAGGAASGTSGAAGGSACKDVASGGAPTTAPGGPILLEPIELSSLKCGIIGTLKVDATVTSVSPTTVQLACATASSLACPLGKLTLSTRPMTAWARVSQQVRVEYSCGPFGARTARVDDLPALEGKANPIDGSGRLLFYGVSGRFVGDAGLPVTAGALHVGWGPSGCEVSKPCAPGSGGLRGRSLSVKLVTETILWGGREAMFVVDDASYLVSATTGTAGCEQNLGGELYVSFVAPP